MQKQNTEKNIHPKYKNIIFDLGGVLISYDPKQILKDLFKDDDLQAVALMKAMHETWLDVDKGMLSPDNAIKQLCKKFDPKKVIAFSSEVPKRFAPLPDGVQILKNIKQKGYKTYILSNLSQPAHQQIAAFDFLKGFDGEIFSYQHGSVKPEPHIYQTLLTTYSLKPEECLFIDDLEVNIQAAKQNGIDGIQCTDHAYVQQQLLDLKVL